MIRLIQHIAVCLWADLWISMPLVFKILPTLQAKFPNISQQVLTVLIFMTVYFFISMGFTMIGNILIRYRLQKAMAWEQAGIPHRAAKQYEKSLALYDSFLRFPFFGKALTNTLIHSLAVFALSNPGSSRFISFDVACLHLKNHPKDTELAKLWIEQFSTKQLNLSTDILSLNVLSNLAQIHKDHKILAPMILDVFLDRGRTDYSAMQLYQHMLKKPDLAAHQKNGIYQLIGTDSSKISGELPTQNWETSLDNREFKNTFSLPHMKKQTNQPRLKHKSASQKRFKMLAGVLVLSIFLIMCARIYILPSHPPSFFISASTSKISVDYAIQLGAFIDKSRGEKLAEKLRKHQNRKVKLIQVKGGQNVWHVVRIEGFQDKNTAREYGKTLEAEKIIQNFFVCISEP